MAAPIAKAQEGLKQCGKLLVFLMGHKDAGPFLEPVLWKEWGLFDYPKVVKTPMDLTTVKGKLEKGQYTHPREFKHDVNLVWTNCMTYNADGSEYYVIASNLKKVFEEKYSKAIREDDDATHELPRQPTLVDKKMFSQNIYNISSEDLGRVVQILDTKCESCIKKIDAEDIEIDIDAIDASSFWIVDSFVRDCLPGGKKASSGGAGGGAKKGGAGAAPVGKGAVGAGGGGSMGAGGGGGGAVDKSKKQRTG